MNTSLTSHNIVSINIEGKKSTNSNCKQYDVYTIEAIDSEGNMVEIILFGKTDEPVELKLTRKD